MYEFGVVGAQADCGLVRGNGECGVTRSSRELPANRSKSMVVPEHVVEFGEKRKTRMWALGLAHRNGSIEPHDR